MKGSKGMTLIEALVAMAIFGVTSLMLVTGYLTAMRLTELGSRIQRGGNQAVSELESAGGGGKTAKDLLVEIEGNRYTIKGGYENGQGEAYPEGQFFVYTSEE